MIFVAERKERRKPVPGYGGRYEVGDLGRVYSGGFEMSLIRGRFVNLCWKGRMDRVDVAYLVARAFLANAEGRPYVVHKDGNKENNRVENLRWSEKRKWGRAGRPVESGRRVAQYTLDGICVGRFASLHEASERTGVSRALIKRCADGLGKKSKGFIWRYE